MTTFCLFFCNLLFFFSSTYALPWFKTRTQCDQRDWVTGWQIGAYLTTGQFVAGSLVKWHWHTEVTKLCVTPRIIVTTCNDNVAIYFSTIAGFRDGREKGWLYDRVTGSLSYSMHGQQGDKTIVCYKLRERQVGNVTKETWNCFR
jgi:hypothetical protein